MSSVKHPSGLTIVHIIRAATGGAFRHVADLSLAQVAAGHRVGIVCDSLTGGDFEAARIADLAPRLPLGIARFAMRRAVSPADLAASWQLLRHVRRLAPDVLHGHGSKGGAYARVVGTLLRLSGQNPVRLYCPHGGSLHYEPGSTAGRVYFAVERALERISDGLVFVSGYEAATYAAKVGTPRVPSVVAHNGLTPEEFEPVLPAPDARDVLLIGALRDLKGVDVLIDAIALLRDQGRTVTAWIVGDGPDGDRFHAQVERLGLGDRIGFRAPMPIRRALPSARMMAVPSRAESLPYVVLEAAAAGVPVIATAVGGIGEIFGPDSNRLIPAGDAAALAGAIGRNLDNPSAAAAMADGLRRRVEAGFSVAQMEATIGNFYALTGASPPRAAAIATAPQAEPADSRRKAS